MKVNQLWKEACVFLLLLAFILVGVKGGLSISFMAITSFILGRLYEDTRVPYKRYRSTKKARKTILIEADLVALLHQHARATKSYPVSGIIISEYAEDGVYYREKTPNGLVPVEDCYILYPDVHRLSLLYGYGK